MAINTPNDSLFQPFSMRFADCLATPLLRTKVIRLYLKNICDAIIFFPSVERQSTSEEMKSSRDSAQGTSANAAAESGDDGWWFYLFICIKFV